MMKRAGVETLDPQAFWPNPAEFYGSSGAVKVHFLLDAYGVNGPTTHEGISDTLHRDLRGDETVVDIGCADGETLHRLYGRGHRGPLLGVDVEDTLLYAAQQLSLAENVPINFIKASATETGLADNSVDVVLQLFMLYLLERPEAGIEEAFRILKPGGRLVVASSHPLNKMRHRQFERRIATHIGIEPPPVLAAHCDLEETFRLVSRHFTATTYSTVQQSPMVIATPDAVEAYLYSLKNTGHFYRTAERSRQRNRAVEQMVRPAIETEIRERGYFEDRVYRGAVTGFKPV